MVKIQVNNHTYSLQKKVGEGYTAQVYKAVTANGLPLCVKIISNKFYSLPSGKQLIDNEISIISRLDHPNILKFYKSQLSQQMMIVTQYCEGGTLYQQLQAKKNYNEQESIDIMRQVIEGCSYLHEKQILHRDLKPENIFLKDGVAKIADFGFAVEASNIKLMKSSVGSPLYMPYEALAQKVYSQKSDIFALGVIWYELLSGYTPFQAATEKQLMEKIKNNYLRNAQLKCSKSITATIMQCLNKNSIDRPSCKELKTFIQELSITRKKIAPKMSIFDSNLTSTKQVSKIIPKRCSKSKKAENRPLKEKQQNKNLIRRMDRCKTVIDINRPKTNSLFEATVKERGHQKQNKQPQVEDTFSFGKKGKSNQNQNKMSSQSSFIDTLRRVAKLNLTFLPHFLQIKFQYLLQKYQRLIITIQSPDNLSSGERKLQIQSSNKDLEKDELIATLAGCTTQFDFCRCAAGFMRRLLRLAKSYQEWSSHLTDLILVGQRIQKMAAIK